MATYRWRIEFDLPGVPIARPLSLGAMQLTPAPRDERGHSRSNRYLVFETEEYLQGSTIETEALSHLEPVAIVAAAIGGSVRAPTVTSVHVPDAHAKRATRRREKSRRLL
jgi:hypothetical protein